jgi:hypothetical protein
MRALILALGLFLVPAMSITQNSGLDIEKYLSRVEKGGDEDVRAEFPSLLSRYPNNPGVLYLQAVLTVDGTEAVRVYQSIVDNFPKNEWADDALYKVYQFYYAIGLYRTAEMKLKQLTSDYPQSKYVTGIAPANTKNLQDEQQTPEPSPVEPVTLSPDRSKRLDVGLPPAQPAENTPRGQYALQVGAYSQQENAEKQRLFFEDLGYSVEVINKVRDARSLFVVLVGNYKTTVEARTDGNEIKSKYNINSMVVTR